VVGVLVAVLVVLAMVALLAVPKLLRNRRSPEERLRRQVDDDGGDEIR
jgi:hypothetical protein